MVEKRHWTNDKNEEWILEMDWKPIPISTNSIESRIVRYTDLSITRSIKSIDFIDRQMFYKTAFY